MNFLIRETEETDLGDEPGRAERRHDADDAERQDEDRAKAKDDPVFGTQEDRVGKRIRKDLLFSLLVLNHVDAGLLPAARDRVVVDEAVLLESGNHPHTEASSSVIN